MYMPILISYAIFVKYKHSNRGIGVCLFLIDTFSRFLFVVMLRNRSTKELVAKMATLLEKLKKDGHHIRSIRSDRERSFESRQYINLLKQYGIETYYAMETPKARFALLALSAT